MNRLLYAFPLLLLVLVVPLAYADVTIETADGSGAPGCENTSDGCFLPKAVTVDVGEIILFLNTDSAAHTFTSGHPDDGPNGLFDTGLIMSGSGFEYKTTQSGVLDYFCMVHPWMLGVINVGGDISDLPVEPTPEPIIDESLIIENQKLRNENTDLKLENEQLKNEISSLKDQIISMTGEFTEMISQLNEWFRTQLS